VTPDGRRAISASGDLTLIVWDLERGDVVAMFSGDGWMSACAVAPDGMTIVAGEGSGRVHVLRLEEAG
jgi:WD40 repeat protein